MPDIEENELIARIEWNENIHVDENRRRVDELFKELKKPVAEHTASIGRQDFILNRERELSSSEAELLLPYGDAQTISPLQQRNLSQTERALSALCHFFLSAGDCV